MPPHQAQHRVVLVTGPSGAGRGTAIRALEDMGFEAIDNLPLSLLTRLIDGPGLDRPMALGIDVRNRDFSTTALIDAIDQLGISPAADVQVLYLDCNAVVLQRRYSETRRRHPLAPAENIEDAIAHELDLLAPIRARADILIDSTDLTPHDLRAELERWFMPGGKRQLSVSVQSFSYKRGLPRSLDLVFDCRFLKNPHWDANLRRLDGRDAAVQAYIAGDARLIPFQDKILDLVQLLLPAYEAEGKAYLSIGFGCTGGQHRSVSCAETLTQALADTGWRVSIRHRELERRNALAPAKGETADRGHEAKNAKG